ncbi:hypothetical protein JCM8097_008016 [Rhodosporidiobolus ruineniae]
MSAPSKCCVCDQDTTTRCEACGKAGFNLFFCSRECQKRVWKYHKRVCGKEEFEQPLLIKAEADEMKRTKDDPASGSSDRPITLSDMLSVAFAATTAEQVLLLLDAVTEGHSRKLKVRAEATAVLTICRYTNFHRKQELLPVSHPDRICPWDSIARVDVNLLGKSIQSPSDWPVWRSPLLHRVLVVQALFANKETSQPPSTATGISSTSLWRSDPQNESIAAQRGVERFIDEEVRSKYGEEEARRVKQALDDVYEVHTRPQW